MPNFYRLAVIVISIVIISSCRTARNIQSGTVADTTTVVVQPDTILVEIVAPVDTALLVIEDTIPEIKLQDTIRIIGVGDIMLGTNYPENYLPPRSINPLDSVNKYLQDADITFGNLEGSILDEGGTPKTCNNPKACYVFRSPEYLSGYLKEAGFDVMSIANNHAGDFGLAGRKNTMKVLDSLGINYAGALLKPYTVFTINDITYGFVAFAPNTGTVSIHDLPEARRLVHLVDSLSDIVIISIHGGAEGKDHQHVTREHEFYYGEDRGNIYQFARDMIDEGADIVFGHGPHVTRAIDIYNGRFIAYSMGNFCTYARFNLSGPNGYAPIIKLNTDREGKFLNGQIIPVKQIGSGIPVFDKEKQVIFKIKDLTHIDFPELKIVVDDNGNINYLDEDF